MSRRSRPGVRGDRPRDDDRERGAGRHHRADALAADDPLDDVLAAPVSRLRSLRPDPALARHAPPGPRGGGPDGVFAVLTNDAFVQALLAGANHEMMRELRWRGFPTDERGTVFHRFWRDDADEVDDLHKIRTGALGAAISGGVNDVVVVVRSELLNRFPGTQVLAVPRSTAGTTTQPDFAKPELPLFRGVIAADVAFFGFGFSAATAMQNPGRFLVFQQPAGAPSFGLDLGTGVRAFPLPSRPRLQRCDDERRAREVRRYAVRQFPRQRRDLGRNRGGPGRLDPAAAGARRRPLPQLLRTLMRARPRTNCAPPRRARTRRRPDGSARRRPSTRRQAGGCHASADRESPASINARQPDRRAPLRTDPVVRSAAPTTPDELLGALGARLPLRPAASPIRDSHPAAAGRGLAAAASASTPTVAHRHARGGAHAGRGGAGLAFWARTTADPRGGLDRTRPGLRPAACRVDRGGNPHGSRDGQARAPAADHRLALHPPRHGPTRCPTSSCSACAPTAPTCPFRRAPASGRRSRRAPIRGWPQTPRTARTPECAG